MKKGCMLYVCLCGADGSTEPSSNQPTGSNLQHARRFLAIQRSRYGTTVWVYGTYGSDHDGRDELVRLR